MPFGNPRPPQQPGTQTRGRSMGTLDPTFYDTLPPQENSQKNVLDQYQQMVGNEGTRALPADTSGFSNQLASLYTGAQPQMSAYYQLLASLQQRADNLYANPARANESVYLYGY